MVLNNENDITQFKKSLDSLVYLVKSNNDLLSSFHESLSILIRLEEKTVSQKNEVDGFGKRLNSFDDRMRALEKTTAVNESKGDTTTKWVERGLWALIVGAVSVLVPFFTNKDN